VSEDRLSDNKKPGGGSRDISDLKARLGLKKGGQQPADPRAGGGIVAPPGATKPGGGYVPPPPGVAAPQPPQPQLPDARDDPFGAMNAMAQQRPVEVQPQIIVVDKNVEQVSPAGKSAAYAKIAAMILVPLILGFLLGGINGDRKVFNHTLGDAKSLDDEFTGMAKELESLNLVLGNAKDRGNGKYTVNDKQLIEDLGGIKFTYADSDKLIVWDSYLYNMKPELRRDILQFYGKVKALSAKVKDHVRLSQASLDKQTPEAFKKLAPNYPEAQVSSLFGAVLRTPQTDPKTGQPTPIQGCPPGPNPCMEFVELGAWACADGSPPTDLEKGTCADGKQVAGLKFRSSAEQTMWGTKAFALDPMVPVAQADHVVPVMLNDIWKSLLQGSPDFLDDAAYKTRIDEIDKMNDDVRKQRFDIEGRLKTFAGQSKALAL
jgi:hypothetical protein